MFKIYRAYFEKIRINEKARDAQAFEITNEAKIICKTYKNQIMIVNF